MKKLLVFLPSLMYGGAEKFIVTLINHLHGVNFEVDLLLGEAKGRFLKDISKDVNIYTLSHASSKKNIISLYKFLSKHQYEVVLATLGACVSLSIVKRLLRYEIKICCRLGNTLSTELDEVKKLSYRKYILQKIGYNSIFSSADVLIAQCEYMRNDIISHFNCKNDIKVVYNGVDIQRIGRLAQEPYHIDNSMINFVAVGEINHQKNHSLMFHAFKNVLDRFPNSMLHVIGDGELLDEIKTLGITLKISDSIVFHGALENPYKILAKADFFVLSSTYEGFSNAILESLVLGVPVIATNSPGGNQEVINNLNGILTADFSIESLTNAVINAVKDKNKFNSREIQSEAKKKFCINNAIVVYSNILNEMFLKKGKINNDKSISAQHWK